jgi:hypothetical protein
VDKLVREIVAANMPGVGVSGCPASKATPARRQRREAFPALCCTVARRTSPAESACRRSKPSKQ